MSAFVVSKDHIDALIDAGLRGRYGSDTLSWRHDGERKKLSNHNADEVGAMLWAENERSVGFRYSAEGRVAIYGEGWEDDDQPLPGTYQLEMLAPELAPIETPEWSTPYHLPRGRVPQRPGVAILKLISCFEYQSCEHGEWEESEAHAFCEALRDHVIGCLPGYEEAKWSL